MLSERRTFRPYGLQGGESGACGQNLWIKQPRERDLDAMPGKPNPPRRINLGGRQTVFMGPGDRIEIRTPGGGGWGKKGEPRKVKEHKSEWESRGSLADRNSAAAASA